MNATIALDDETALANIQPNALFLMEESDFSRGAGIYSLLGKKAFPFTDRPDLKEMVCDCQLIGEVGHGSEIVPLREPYWVRFVDSEKVYPLRITTK